MIWAVIIIYCPPMPFGCFRRLNVFRDALTPGIFVLSGLLLLDRST
jgi:hypothetical protein